VFGTSRSSRPYYVPPIASGEATSHLLQIYTNHSLQDYLKSNNSAVRGAVIQALRFTLADTSQNYNNVLKPVLAPMLTTMLADPELENHRLALTTLNSAIHNKVELVLPSLPVLLPLVMQDTYVKKELVREVTMGPFKHKVDDGLEIRKVCWNKIHIVTISSPIASPISTSSPNIIRHSNPTPVRLRNPLRPSRQPRHPPPHRPPLHLRPHRRRRS
jgi:TATA-binding protein interacting (TIP20)